MQETVEGTIEVDASNDQVWAVLADIGSISTWAAPIADAEVEGEPGEGAARHCTFADGGSIEETFVAWEDGRLQRYEIEGDLPAAELVSEWCLEEGDDGGSQVTYRARFTPAEGASPEEVRAELEGTSTLLLEALKRYVETGEVLEPAEA